MIKLFFGLPGAGKTTLAVKHLIDATDKYENVYANFHTCINGVTYIDGECIGKYDLSNSFIAIDEGSLFANCRNKDALTEQQLEFFILSRHFCCDVNFYNQRSNGMDKNLRELTAEAYYLYKSFPLGFWQTKYYRIPYKVMIPDAKSGSSRVGEILMGYYQPPALVKLFAKSIWRPNYYKYFDSFETVYRPKLPVKYRPYYAQDLKKLSGALFGCLREPLIDPSHFSSGEFEPCSTSKISCIWDRLLPIK